MTNIECHYVRSRSSSVLWRGYGLDDRSSIPWKTRDIFFVTSSRPALKPPSQAPIQWVLGALSPGVKRPGCEVDYSHPSSADVTNAWRYISISQYALMAWCSVQAQVQL